MAVLPTLAIAAVVGPSLALASGFALKEQSASGLGTAFAGATAIAEDPSTLFFNPAGMARLEGNQLLTVGSYISVSAEYSGSGSSAAGAPRSGNGKPGDAVTPAEKKEAEPVESFSAGVFSRDGSKILATSAKGWYVVNVADGTRKQILTLDKDESKIERLRSGVMPIYEPGLAELVAAMWILFTAPARAGGPAT